MAARSAWHVTTNKAVFRRLNPLISGARGQPITAGVGDRFFNELREAPETGLAG